MFDYPECRHGLVFQKRRFMRYFSDPDIRRRGIAPGTGKLIVLWIFSCLTLSELCQCERWKKNCFSVDGVWPIALQTTWTLSSVLTVAPVPFRAFTTPAGAASSGVRARTAIFANPPTKITKDARVFSLYYTRTGTFNAKSFEIQSRKDKANHALLFFPFFPFV